MKFLLKFVILSLLCVGFQNTASAKKAVLVTHYGSSDDNTRATTIDVITEDIREAFPGFHVEEAYISPVVRKYLLRRGIVKHSPDQALIRLCAEGYDSVYVQSTTIIDGVEMAEVRMACDRLKSFFNLLKCSEPLCYSPENCAQLIDILAKEPRGKNEAVVFVGHGNLLPSTATYCQLDYMLGAAGHQNYYVSTIEGYPTASTTISQIKRTKADNVKLIPLLLVCGNHTKQDIAGEYAESISEAGYKVDVVMRGLAELPAVRHLYIERLNSLID